MVKKIQNTYKALLKNVWIKCISYFWSFPQTVEGSVITVAKTLISVSFTALDLFLKVFLQSTDLEDSQQSDFASSRKY